MSELSGLMNEVTVDAVAATEEAVEETVEEDTEEVLNSQDVQMETRSASSNSDSNNSASSKSKSSSSNSGTSVSGNSSSSSGNSGSSVPVSSTSSPKGSGTTTPNPVSTHTHNWKEHTATRQVWVPNIVVIDDYEEQAVNTGYLMCDCGAKISND